MKWVIAFFAWWLGTAAIVGFVRGYTTADWTNWFAIIVCIIWGGVAFWIASKF